jgi:hypothetical protein
MSNNPGFGDYNNARRSPSLFAANIISNSGNPREENFWKFLTNFFCPFFRFKSFISLITLIDIIMYIVTLTYDGIDDVDNGLLAPTFKALDMFGMSVILILCLELHQDQKWSSLATCDCSNASCELSSSDNEHVVPDYNWNLLGASSWSY